MKRVIVTGAKGGTGPSIANMLRTSGYQVIATDIKPLEPGDSDYVQLNLCNAAELNDAFAGADAIVHFGSVPGSAGMTDTQAFQAIAVAGFNVFQAARNVGIRRIAWASSIQVYGDLRLQSHLPITEDSPTAPRNIYGSSKLLLENLAKDFCRWHGMSIASFRLTRVIYESEPGRQKLHRLTTDSSAGADCLWSYVDARDVARACQAWIESEVQGAEVFNLSADEIHLECDIQKMLKQYGYHYAQINQSFGTSKTPYSSKKIYDLLGWNSRHHYRQILAEPNNDER